MDSSSAESSIGGSLNLRRSYLSAGSASAPGEMPLPVYVTQLEDRSPVRSDPVFNLGNLRTTDSIIFKNLKLVTNMSNHTDISSQQLEVSDIVSSDIVSSDAAAVAVPPEERAFLIPSGDLVHLREVSDIVSSDDVADLVPSEEVAALVPSDDVAVCELEEDVKNRLIVLAVDVMENSISNQAK